MRHWLIYDSYDETYLILDTEIRASSRKWDLLNNIFNTPIIATNLYDEELYGVINGDYQKFVEFQSLPTYPEFCQAYPEFCI